MHSMVLEDEVLPTSTRCLLGEKQPHPPYMYMVDFDCMMTRELLFLSSPCVSCFSADREYNFLYYLIIVRPCVQVHAYVRVLLLLFVHVA